MVILGQLGGAVDMILASGAIVLSSTSMCLLECGIAKTELHGARLKKQIILKVSKNTNLFLQMHMHIL